MTDANDNKETSLAQSQSGEHSQKSFAGSSPPDANLLGEKIASIEMEALEQKKKLLLEIERRVDLKMTQLQAIVSEAQAHGRGFAGSNQSRFSWRKFRWQVVRTEIFNPKFKNFTLT